MGVIEVQNLSKKFRIAERQAGVWGAISGLIHRTYLTAVALDGVSFSIDRGEIVGYIGPNGAGKSTTVKILSGIMVPDGGTCRVMGAIPWNHRIETVRKIGVVFGQRSQLWWDLPVIESFELLRDIYSVEPRAFCRKLDELVNLLDLSSLLNVPVRQLSLGQRMRCELVAALLHDPAILFLDEPTIGLDAVSKIAVRAFVRDLSMRQGVTVLLTTHDMDDIEALCSRILIIDQGRIFLDGTLDELRKRVSRERHLIVDLAESKVPLGTVHADLISNVNGRYTLRFDPCKISPADLIAEITAKHTVRDLFVVHPSIEQVLAQLYSRNGKGTPLSQEANQKDRTAMEGVRR